MAKLTRADRLDAICEELGARYERMEPEGGPVSLTLHFLGKEGSGFIEGDRITGRGPTTEDALAMLESRLGKGEK